MALPLLPLISVGLQAAGSVFSFKQAKEQRMRKAQRDAAKALEDKGESYLSTYCWFIHCKRTF